MSPKEGIIPPGGHHFIEQVGGATHRIDGDSFRDVAEKLLKFRVANKIAVGQPMDEINEYVCKNWPHFCHMPSQEPNYRVSAEPSFTIAVLHWVTKLWQRQALTPTPLVPDAEAARRAAVCRECPMQRDWADYGCGACVEGVRKRSFVFRAGRDIGVKVTGCSVLKQDNTSAIFASHSSLPEVTAEENAKLPSNCWRKHHAAK